MDGGKTTTGTYSATNTTTTTTTTTSVGMKTTIPSYRSIQIEPDIDDDNVDETDYQSDSSFHSRYNNDVDDDHDNDRNETTGTHHHHQPTSSSSSAATATASLSPPPPLSILAAALALMKGNLGPGILNLPHAFSQLYNSSRNNNNNNDTNDFTASPISPTIIIIILFSIVTVQGLYSMTLLVYCKNILNQNHTTSQSSLPSSYISPTSLSTPRVVVTTFMDVTKATFGTRGGRMTELLIFVVQIGVCCVFISLISTNIQVFVKPMISITPFLSISFITLFFLIVVTLFRYIHDLFYFNAIANTFMLTAILTVTMTSIMLILQQRQLNEGESTNIQQERIETVEDIYGSSSESSSDTSSSSSSSKIVVVLLQASITFIADLFFAFEGIGLVLPVENNYTLCHVHDPVVTNPGTVTTVTRTTGNQSTHTTTTTTSSPRSLVRLYRTNSANHRTLTVPTIRAVNSTEEPILLSTTIPTTNVNQENVEESYYRLHHPRQQSRWTFTSVLLMSMGSVAILFAIIGFTSSIAFLDVHDNMGIQNGSVTAFLQETYPDNLWYPIINVMVVLAVAMTFPLQLTPAMEVLDKWLLECRNCQCNWHQCLRTRYYYFHPPIVPRTTLGRIDSHDDMMIQHMDHSINHPANRNSGRVTSEDGIYITPPDIDLNDDRHLALSSTSFRTTPASVSVVLVLWNEYGWMIRRWIVVISCSTIVLVVNDLGLLVSLFGAVGQTGLAAMPCAVHLALQYQQQIAPKNILLTIADVLVLIFCAIVMIAGCSLSIHDIFK